jgi:hypothetical protein
MMPLFLRYKKYAEVTVIADSNLDSLQVKLKPFTTVIIGYHKSDVAFKRMIYDQMNCLKLIFLPKTILLFWMFC